MTSSVWPRRLAATQEARMAERIRAVERSSNKTSRNTSAGNPSVRCFNNAAISIVNNTLTVPTFNSETWNNGWLSPAGVAMHSTASNTGQIIAPLAGIYDIGAQIDWAANVTGKRWVLLRVNANYIAGDTRPVDGGGDANMPVNTQWKLAVGDAIDVQVLQNSGAPLNLVANTGAARSPALYATWIAPG